MLVKVEDIKSKTVYINPMYVKAVAEVKGGVTEISISFGAMLSTQYSIKTREPAEQIAVRISEALSMLSPLAAFTAANEEADAAQKSAAATNAAAMSG